MSIEKTNYRKMDEKLQFQLLVLKELNEKLSVPLEMEAGKVFKEKLNKDMKQEIQNNLQHIQWIPLESQKDTETKYTPISDELADIVYDKILMPIQFIKFIREMGLVFLVTEFENFLKDILLLTFSKNPKVLSTCKKNISFEELMEFSDITSVREKIIDKEVNEIINKDVQDIIDYFRDRLGIDISPWSSLEDFKERFYRRNLIIHNSGIPNRIYKEKTGYDGEIKHLEVTTEYLQQTIYLFSVFADDLTQKLENKFGKDVFQTNG